MQLDDVLTFLSDINGSAFVSLSAVTYPARGIRKTTTETVLVIQSAGTSGYEAMVRRRLLEAGKNPDNFVLSDLPWGERLEEGSPIIVLRDKYYLQTIFLSHGEYHYFIGETEVDPKDLALPSRRTNQGLARGDEVLVKTYALDSIVELRLLDHI